MSRIDILSPYILFWEGGFACDPNDRGGATNKGITIKTWMSQGWDKDGDGCITVSDLKLITDKDAMLIMKKNFWDKWQADRIRSQSLANMLVDWLWCSGVWGVKIPQAMLGLNADGIVGDKTLCAVNAQEPKVFFEALKNRRKQYLRDICIKRPANNKFLNGWLKRLDGLRYGSLAYGGKEVLFG